MTKFPKDAPKRKVIKAFEALGFRIVKLGKNRFSSKALYRLYNFKK